MQKPEQCVSRAVSGRHTYSPSSCVSEVPAEVLVTVTKPFPSGCENIILNQNGFEPKLCISYGSDRFCCALSDPSVAGGL